MQKRVGTYRTRARFPCCNLFILYLLRFSPSTRYSPFIRQHKCQVMLLFRFATIDRNWFCTTTSNFAPHFTKKNQKKRNTSSFFVGNLRKYSETLENVRYQHERSKGNCTSTRILYFVSGSTAFPYSVWVFRFWHNYTFVLRNVIAVVKYNK